MTEAEKARRLAEACIRDRLVGFAVVGTVGTGSHTRVNLGRIRPETEAEKAWKEYCDARTARPGP